MKWEVDEVGSRRSGNRRSGKTPQLHTSNLFVSISGGSVNLCRDSENTKVAITTRNKPFINPDNTSTRSNL